MQSHNLDSSSSSSDSDSDSGDAIAIVERRLRQRSTAGAAFRCCCRALGTAAQCPVRALLCPLMSVLAIGLAMAIVVLLVIVLVRGPAASEDDAEVLVTSAYERLKGMLPAWATSTATGPQRRWLETILTSYGAQASGYVDLEPTRICANITHAFGGLTRLTTYDAVHHTTDYAWIGNRGCFTTNTTLVLGVPGVQQFIEFVDPPAYTPRVRAVARLL